MLRQIKDVFTSKRFCHNLVLLCFLVTNTSYPSESGKTESLRPRLEEQIYDSSTCFVVSDLYIRYYMNE
jgi:hypothetical protein